MNREQAKQALRALEPSFDPSAVNWHDVAGEIAKGERHPSRDPESRAKEEAALAILRQHRDHLRTEDEAMAVWHDVFVGQAIRVSAWEAEGMANAAEKRFRERLADHLKARGQ